ncbi:MAG: hypothetical protein AAGA23_05840 [Pseudomonadota bacterium]
MIQVLAAAGTAGSFLLLQAAWRRQTRSWPLVAAGWGMLVLSLTGWSFSSGTDKGVALGVVAGIVIVLLFLAAAAARAKPRPAKPARQRRAPPAAASRWQLPRRVWIFLLAGPFAGLAALGLSTAAFVALQTHLNLEHTANLTLVSFGFPLAWAGLAVAVGYQPALWRKTAAVLVPGLVSLAFLWTGA